jgi:hypothetical protein
VFKVSSQQPEALRFQAGDLLRERNESQGADYVSLGPASKPLPERYEHCTGQTRRSRWQSHDGAAACVIPVTSLRSEWESPTLDRPHSLALACRLGVNSFH